MPDTYCASFVTPIGQLTVMANNTALTRIAFAGEIDCSDGIDRATPMLQLARRQLTEYFAGRRTRFELPLEMEGTEWQLRVWRALECIPYGCTRTYGELALGLTGKLTTARAVGLCCGRNPLPIVVPCHRVLGANGSLTGFGGGLWRKEWLLRHEGVLAVELPLK
jgi:methylated-DNA-[protein]-cysteine S-methyltransferase